MRSEFLRFDSVGDVVLRNSLHGYSGCLLCFGAHSTVTLSLCFWTSLRATALWEVLHRKEPNQQQSIDEKLSSRLKHVFNVDVKVTLLTLQFD